MDKHLNVDQSNELLSSSSKPQRLFINNQNIQDEEESDCPLLTPSPPPSEEPIPSDLLETPESTMFNRLDQNSPAIEEIKSAVATALTINNNNSNIDNGGEASSRDPMVESSSSEESRSVTKEPVCTQLLTQLNTAYQHLAPDAQAIFYSQENGGIPPLVGIQVVMPKSPKDFAFTQWNWPQIRRMCFWLMIGLITLATTVAVRGIITMPRRCDPPTEWWQGRLFYEIFPASFQDSSNVGDGIGDLRGIITRLNYLKGLGVKTIRLNSIFQSTHYPEHYLNVINLTSIDDNVGSIKDFDNLVESLHRNDINLVLDIPVHAYISRKIMGNKVNMKDDLMMPKDNKMPPNGNKMMSADNKMMSNINIPKMLERRKRHLEDMNDNLTSVSDRKAEIDIELTTLINSPKYERYMRPNAADLNNNPLHEITLALTYWRQKNVDGFYLKGLEYYVDNPNFINFLDYWKDMLGSQRILMCSWKALQAAKKPEVKEKLMKEMDLIDVRLKLMNGTKQLKKQIDEVLTTMLVDHDGVNINRRTWIYWAVGSLDTMRIASSLTAKNASNAALVLAMMLPGTPGIFYGDEIGVTDCNCEDHNDLENLHNLSPMLWPFILHNKTEKFSSNAVMSWIPSSPLPVSSTMDGAIPQMVNLRKNAAPIYVEAAQKHDRISINCEIRYLEDELIIIERWYPRQNTYVLVANFGNSTQKKDFSTLYYEGEIVIGPSKRLNELIYFREFIIAPGEVYVVKLKK